MLKKIEKTSLHYVSCCNHVYFIWANSIRNYVITVCKIMWLQFSKLLYVVVIFKITLRGRHFQNYSTWSPLQKITWSQISRLRGRDLQNYVVTSFKITLCGRHLQNYFVASSKIMWMPFLKLHCRHLKNYLVATCKITWALFTILCGRHLKNYLVAICKIHGRFL